MGIFRRRNPWIKDVIENETNIENEQLNGSIAGDIIFRETFGNPCTCDAEFAADFTNGISDQSNLFHETHEKNDETRPNCNVEFAEEFITSIPDNGTSTHEKIGEAHARHESEFAEEFITSIPDNGTSTHEKIGNPQPNNTEFAEDMDGINEYLDAGVTENTPYQNTAKYKMITSSLSDESTFDTSSS